MIVPSIIKPPKGFSLVELMIVMVILAVLATISAPWLGQFIRDQRVKSASFELNSTLAFARSEAVKRARTVTLTPIDSTNWALGWVVTAGTENVRKQGSLGESISATPTTTASSLTYRPDGRLTTSGVVSFNLTATGAGITKRCIRIDPSGTPSSLLGTCS